MEGTAENIAGRPLLDDLAGIEDRDRVAEAVDDPEVVADEEDAPPLGSSDGFHEIQDLRLDGHVERRGRLVEDEERGVTGQRRGNESTLLHAPAELVGIGAGYHVRARGPHLHQELAGGLKCLAPREPAVVDQRLGDLEADPERRVQRRERVLEDHADPVASQRPPLVRRQAAEVSPREAERARAERGFGTEEPEDRERRRALAGAGLADEAQGTALLDVERHVRERRERPPVGPVFHREVADLEERPRLGHERLARAIRGSRISRSPSPSRLTPRTVRHIASPGAMATQGAVSTKARASPIMSPQSELGG